MIHFLSPPGNHNFISRSLSSGTDLSINVQVISGTNRDVDFFIADELNYYKWRAGEIASIYLKKDRTTGFTSSWVVPHSDTWFFVYSNDFSIITSKGVTTSIERAYIDVEGREVTKEKTLLESKYSYLGITFILLGSLISIAGFALKTRKNGDQVS